MVPLVFKTSLGAVRSPEGSTPSLLRQHPVFISNGMLPDDFQNKVLDFELKAIGTDQKNPPRESL